jgi:hypothetical protein
MEERAGGEEARVLSVNLLHSRDSFNKMARGADIRLRNTR